MEYTYTYSCNKLCQSDSGTSKCTQSGWLCTVGTRVKLYKCICVHVAIGICSHWPVMLYIIGHGDIMATTYSCKVLIKNQH